ncbi:MAG: hypothetical protein RBT41_10640 [Clostridia bacterium]|jgi:hypothetical protein|nr:hypothetical protein [Clostridia bacterium]
MNIHKKESIIWISISAAILVISILALVGYHTRLTILTQSVMELEGSKNVWAQREAELTLEIADLQAQIEQNAELIKAFPSNNPEIINSLKQQGLNGGLQEIVDDLIKHSELIPYQGVLGGKMDFYSKEDIFVISDRWVLAYFEDGHIGGNILLEYRIKNKNISWKVIDSYLFE